MASRSLKLIDAEDLDPELVKSVEQRLTEFHQNQECIRENSIGYPLRRTTASHLPNDIRDLCIINVGNPFESRYPAVTAIEMEKKSVQYFMNLWEISTEETPIYWGYTGFGSIEGIIEAGYLGREYLKNPTVLYSPDAHYTIPKAIHLLNLPSLPVASHTDGSMSMSSLARQLARLDRFDGVILMLTLGTTMKGANDNISQAMMEMNKAGFDDACRYVHVDGALGGLLTTFDNRASPAIRPSFSRQGIDSISVSGHKFIGISTPSCMFVGKKQKTFERDAEYVKSSDTTIASSRNGQAILEMWTRIKLLSHEFPSDTVSCIEGAKEIEKQFRGHGIPTLLNGSSCTVVFPAPPEDIERKYSLAVQGSIAHVVAMPGISAKKVQEFISVYARWWNSTTQSHRQSSLEIPCLKLH